MLPPPKELLERYGLRPKYSFGQNFLSDPNTSARIAALAIGDAPEGSLSIVEIGAGLGALTDKLLSGGHKVTAIERDRDLIPALGAIFPDEIGAGRLTVLEADAKAVDWAELFQGAARPVLAGNLPYQITGPLLEKTCLLSTAIERAVFLVQKEVGDRLAAAPGTGEYGALSVFVQARFRVKRAFVVGSGAFYPAPRVSSAVVLLEPHPERVSEETPTFRKVVQSAFHSRRKTLRNCWKGLAAPEVMLAICNECGVDLDARGETLGVEAFARVAHALERRESEEA